MKVKLKENINLNDLKENHWNGCQDDTMRFLTKHYSYTDDFEASEKCCGYYKIDDYNVNEKCFELIKEDENIEKIDLSEWSEITYQEDWEMLAKDFNRNCNLFVNKINKIIDYLEEKDKNE